MKNLIVDNTFNIDKFTSLITPENERIIISFDGDLSDNDLKEVLRCTDLILDEEEKEPEKRSNVYFNFKGFSTHDLTILFQHFLRRETLINENIIVNINLLISGYNTLDDSMFSMSEIYVSDLEQFLDIKLELADDIKEVQTNTIKWYLACLKSMHRIELTYLDTPVKLPNLYRQIIASNTLLTLSHIFGKAKGINTDDLPLVENAYPIVIASASTSAIGGELLKAIGF
jgi:hypothetical protein